MKGKRIPYSAAELAWVEQNCGMHRRDLHAAFVRKFKRSDVTEQHIRSLCTRKGWSAGPEGRKRLAGASTLFSSAEIEWLKQSAGLSRADAYAQFVEAFGRDDISEGQVTAYRKRNGIKCGGDGRFVKGQHSWNKGKKLPVSDAFKATMFKKGHVPHNQNYIGHERINHEGYVEISVAKPNPYTKADRHYVTKHRLLWEEINGPVPEGHVLKCLDGDKQNTDPKNWLAIPRALLPRLNGRWGSLSYDEAEPELKPYILAAARLQHAAREARKSGGAK
jgi:hypothetical protein